jgi:chromosome segregation ATPase
MQHHVRRGVVTASGASGVAPSASPRPPPPQPLSPSPTPLAISLPSVVEDSSSRHVVEDLDAAVIVVDAVEQLDVAQEALRQMTSALVDSRSEASAAAQRAAMLGAELTEARSDIARARVIEAENTKLRAECTKLSSELAAARSNSSAVAEELLQLQGYARTLEQIAYEEGEQQSAPEKMQSIVHVSRHGSVSVSPAAGAEASVEDDLAVLRDLFNS